MNAHTLAAACLLLCGCAAQPPFQAAWYLVSAEPKKAAAAEEPLHVAKNSVDVTQRPLQVIEKPLEDKLYIGLLNQSDRSQEVVEIILNAASASDPQGWRLKGPFQLEPGEMLVRPALQFKKAGKDFPSDCRLPVSVVVVVGPTDIATQAEIRGRMPNFLPTDWEVCPK